MKNIKFSILALSALFFVACSNDDDTPMQINEEETITTMTVTLVPTGGGTNITLQSQDLDGDGPNPPTITVSGDLAANTAYSGTIVLLNETETPAENITTEVQEEAEEHQFFFTSTGNISNILYADQDADGNPIGISFALSTQDAGSASLTITLRHEPKKPNDGTLADAGGETDIAQSFDLTIM